MADDAARPEPTADAGGALWSCHRPPGTALLVWAGFIGLLFGIASLWLVRHLVDLDAWALGGAVGVFLGALVPLSIMRGASCRVEADGTLVYGYGRRDDLRVPLAAIGAWMPVQAGMLSGVGADCAPEDVQLLHRKGLSYSKMDSYRRGLGVALVLEFLTEADLQALRELQERLTGSAAPLRQPTDD